MRKLFVSYIQSLNLIRTVTISICILCSYPNTVQAVDCGPPGQSYIDWDDDGAVEKEPIYTYKPDPLNSCIDVNAPRHWGIGLAEREASTLPDWEFFDCAPGDPTKYVGTYTYGNDADGDGYPYPLTEPQEFCAGPSLKTPGVYGWEGKGFYRFEDPFPNDDDLPYAPGVLKDTDSDGAPDSDRSVHWSDPDILSGKASYISPYDYTWGDGAVLLAAAIRAYDVDCDQRDPTNKGKKGLYVDQDNDGYGSGTLQEICITSEMQLNDQGIPIGYAKIDGDCNDLDSSLNQNCETCPKYTKRNSTTKQCECERTLDSFSPDDSQPRFRDTPAAQKTFEGALCLAREAANIINADGLSFQPKTTSAYRSPEYQKHLVKVKAAKIWVNQISGPVPKECVASISNINAEWSKHGLSMALPIATNSSKHSDDDAIDFTWNGQDPSTKTSQIGNPGSPNIDEIAKICNMCRPFPPLLELQNPTVPTNYKVDSIHFVRTGTSKSGNCYNSKLTK